VLLVHGADRTWRHLASRPSDHWVPDLCLTILSPLHQVSYSCHDPHCCPLYRIRHLHTKSKHDSLHKIDISRSTKTSRIQIQTKTHQWLITIKLRYWSLDSSVIKLNWIYVEDHVLYNAPHVSLEILRLNRISKEAIHITWLSICANLLVSHKSHAGCQNSIVVGVRPTTINFTAMWCYEINQSRSLQTLTTYAQNYMHLTTSKMYLEFGYKIWVKRIKNYYL
jgi:hypothetical protein